MILSPCYTTDCQYYANIYSQPILESNKVIKMKLTLSLIGLSLVFASLIVPQTEAARILGIFPSPSKSHLLIHCAVADTLAEAGHEVTVISTVPNLYKRAKYNFIHVQGAMYDEKFANKMVNKPAPAYVKFYNVMSSVMTMANTTINHPTMQDFLQHHKAGDFDLVILGYFMNDFFLGIGAHFQCPVIVSFMVQPIFPINNMIANPLEASYVQTIFSGVRQPMDFWSRVKNLLSVAIEEIVLMNVLRSNMNKMYSILVSIACCAVIQCQAARILGVFPSPSKSHVLIHCAVADALAEAGHEVTVIATVPNMLKKAKYNFLHVEGAMFDSNFAQEMLNKPASIYRKFNGIISHVIDMANVTMNQPKIQNFLQTHKAGDFDAVILGYFMNDFMLGFGAHFQCPIILSFMVQPIFPINKMIGNPLEASYVPTLYSGYKQPMDFASRVKNFLANGFEHLVLGNLMQRKLETMYGILGIFPTPFKSHLIIHSAIAETLAAAGHNVIIMGSFPNVMPQAKYQYIHLEGKQLDGNFVTKTIETAESTHKKFNHMIGVAMKSANNSLNHPKMKEFLNQHQAGDFDLVILGYFMNDFLLGLGAHFQCPIIISFMIRPIFAIDTIVGNPEEPAYVPTLFSNLKEPLDFGDRVKNYLANFVEHNIMERAMRRKMQEMYSFLQAANILGFFPSPSKSHLIIHSSIAETLAAAGHNVTVIAAFPNLLPKAKYQYIHLDDHRVSVHPFAQSLVDKPEPFYKKFKTLIDMITSGGNGTMQHPKMLKFLSTHGSGDFDVIILGYFMNDFMLGLGAHFQCPIILSFMVRSIFAIDTILGNPQLPAYVPTLFDNLQQPMDFGDRVRNFLLTLVEGNVMLPYMMRKVDEIYGAPERKFHQNIYKTFNNMLKLVFFLMSLLTSAYYAPTQAARILAVFPSPSKSHLLIHCAIAETLAADGHEVTVIATLPNMYAQAKYHYLQVDGAMFLTNFAQEMLEKPAHIYGKFNGAVSHLLQVANDTLNHNKMLHFLHNHKAGDFDALILGYCLDDFVLGLGAHFQCPIILSFMIQPIFPIQHMLANPLQASYVPTLYSGLRQPMDFVERIKNFLAHGYEQMILFQLMKWKMKKYYRYNFPADRYPPLEEVYKNVSLVLTNHHFSQGPIRPNVPALIEIGGIQIKEKPDPLPQDLAEIIESSDKGVIFFSLGTNVQGSNLSKDKAKMIFNVLSKLPYTVLLKWGDSDFPGQSKNMIYRSWLPQDDILAHPKVKLFITHGGMGSVVESQYHGVPMVGIPFFGDQHSNIANVVKSGFGLGLEYARFSEEAFRQAVVEVLENPTYTQNVQKFSELYRDRPMTPRQLVRYWVDYVIRHNGAKHMQSPAINMTWWQLYSLDVIAFLLSIILGVVALLVGLCKLLCCRGKGATKAATKKVSKSKKQK
ncbi:hypothetical protein FF38_08248 [Lucilia cuprina]|uniref:UDP-glycosyltransferases domain-containing protein n=2 Tax=Lucilia cuprina TaxID=7375 RepID=A0A0L0BYQ3_LUCCU|nr:hypothetical protein FF38_08248 [Lucilia cuprina]